MAAEGQVSRPECEKLVELARGTAPGSVIVEIGTYRGRSTIALALGARQGARNRVYAIDPHLEFHGVLGGEFGPEDQAALYANLARAGVGALVSVVGLASAAVARGWSEQNVGLLWIDGDHRYEAVRADCDAWWRFVTPGGTIAFHDADTPDVRRIIGELREQGRIAVLGEMGRLLWSRRPA
jgi:predicted O-methyltransferase YrrM